VPEKFPAHFFLISAHANEMKIQSGSLNTGYRLFFFFVTGIILVFSYKNSLPGTFIFDDFGNIVGNKYIAISSLSFSELQKVFSPNQNCKNRKIANLTFALNYYFGKLNPVGFHVVNILIHIINAWLVFILFQWYFSRIPPPKKINPVIISGLAALWWATNPIQTSAVTYIVQRMTSLSTLFCLVALLLYLQARTHENREQPYSAYKRVFVSVLALLSWLLAMMSKEIAAILPILVIAHEIYFFGLVGKIKTNLKISIILFLVCSGFIIGEILFFLGPEFIRNILQSYVHRNFTLTERLLTEPRVIFHYFSLFLYPLPTRLRLYYDTFIISHNLWSPSTTALALFGIGVWIFAIYFFFKRNKLLSLGLLWTLLCLLLESSFIALELVFEHRFYMPSIGFVLALMASILWIMRTTAMRPAFLYGCIGILICSQALGTSTRNRAWADTITFSINEVEKNPDSVRALTNLGLFLIKQGHPKLAEKPLLKAYSLDSENIVVLNDLFSIYVNPPYHRYAHAESYLTQIIHLIKEGKAKPTDTEALNNLSFHLFNQKRYWESLLLLHQVANFYGASEVFLHIGQCNIQLGQFKAAITALEHALQLEPNNPELHYYCALSYQRSHDEKIAQSIISSVNLDAVQDQPLHQHIMDLQKILQVQATTNKK